MRSVGYVSGIVQDDEVRVRGVPNLTLRIPGGVPGDIATASIGVNSIPKVPAARPGLQTMKDLALPSYYSGR